MTDDTVSVLIVDDEPLIRMGLRALIENEPDLRVVGEAGDGTEAAEKCKRLLPDVVILDVRMPRMDGLDVLRTLSTSPATQNIRVIILTTFEQDDYIMRALQDGASGFLVKDGDPGQLLAAIRAVNAGDSALGPSVTNRVIEQLVRRTPTSTGVPGMSLLTDREREVVVLAARGLTNKEIARELLISVATVRTHVTRAMFKLDVHDRSQLVALAYRTGIAYEG
ncbi:MAG: response regulator transcription factor [Tetrasphaera sp.]